MGKWNTTKLVTVGSFSVLYFLLWAPISFSVAVSSNIMVALADFILFPFINILICLIVKEFGTATISNATTFAIDRVLPHSIPIIIWLPVILTRGIAVDLVFKFFKGREKLATMIGGAAINVLTSVYLVVLLIVLGLPIFQKIPSVFYNVYILVGALLLIGVFGLISGYLAYIVYDKLKNTNVVRMIQGEKIELEHD
jgi:hypothetical protein